MDQGTVRGKGVCVCVLVHVCVRASSYI